MKKNSLFLIFFIFIGSLLAAQDIHRGIQKWANGNVGASDLQQAQPLALRTPAKERRIALLQEEQELCKHKLDTASCKDEDADEASGQFSNHDVYKPSLTIWIRSFGNDSANIIVPYVNEVETALSEDFELKILVATKPNDPVLKALEEVRQDHCVTALQTNLDSISQGLNTLIGSTPPGCYVLSLSQGVEIDAKHIKEAFSWFEKGAWAYGWQISNLNNDGSAPGRGWYHTAALYPSSTLTWMKTHLFPYWIDTGVEGSILVDGEKIPIGNNEEVILMATVLQDHPHAFFVHNTKDILNLARQTGNGISFAQKLKRKVPVAAYYLKNKFNVNPEDVWSHLVVIQPVSPAKNDTR